MVFIVVQVISSLFCTPEHSTVSCSFSHLHSVRIFKCFYSYFHSRYYEIITWDFLIVGLHNSPRHCSRLDGFDFFQHFTNHLWIFETLQRLPAKYIFTRSALVFTSLVWSSFFHWYVSTIFSLYYVCWKCNICVSVYN